MYDVTLIYLLFIGLVYLLLWRRSPEKTRQSLHVAGTSTRRMLPMLSAIFGLIGLFQIFVPPSLIENWLGGASGWRSLLAGGALGALVIGPPPAAFPLAGSLLDAGAWPPAVAAFVVAWISVGIVTLPFEAEIFGARFAIVRNTLAFVTALLIGLLIGSWT
ncbi:hypothetical protein [Trichloromonas acetexigens]|uniref:Permease n=1 Tax=Trichloromonas acetexigens TaxID=38815 RepID=A0A550JIZ9_9BACT|nr:hypothetical protein [Desulfuromonas acetexigens]TRO83171.1 permease [Desulfuromonas acetexigens]